MRKFAHSIKFENIVPTPKRGMVVMLSSVYFLNCVDDNKYRLNSTDGCYIGGSGQLDWQTLFSPAFGPINHIWTTYSDWVKDGSPRNPIEYCKYAMYQKTTSPKKFPINSGVTILFKDRMGYHHIGTFVQITGQNLVCVSLDTWNRHSDRLVLNNFDVFSWGKECDFEILEVWANHQDWIRDGSPKDNK